MSQGNLIYLGIACLRGMYTFYLDIACLIGIYYAVLEIPPAELIPISNPDLQNLSKIFIIMICKVKANLELWLCKYLDFCALRFGAEL